MNIRSSIYLAILLGVTNGEITDMQTGRHFRSRQETELLCKRLWRGYEYMGRLQYIEENPYLCPTGENDVQYTITKPSDSLPVALLVQGGGCSLKEKVDMVLNKTTPGNTVRYLIVGYGRRKLGENLEEFEEEVEDEESVLSELTAALLPTSLKNSLLTDESWISISRRKNPKGDVIPLYIVRVSDKTVSQILNEMIKKQSDEMKAMGGPRISLDSRGSSMDGDTGALWLSLVSLLCACMCSFMLIINNNHWVEAEEQARQAAQQRPTRRRLTRDQVRDLLPKYLYDAESHTLEVIVEEGRAWNDAVQEIPMLPERQEMDCCSICLDDYVTGNKLRCLPCHHAFHSNCIGKWLSERSATCPLCKIELLPEEEEDEESENEILAEPNQLANEGSGWLSRLLRSSTSRNDNALVETGETEVQVNHPLETEFPQESWWRRIFPSRSTSTPAVEESVMEMLTEPLLPDALSNTSNNASQEETEGLDECLIESTPQSESVDSSRQMIV